jgi:phage-related protein
MILKPYSFYGTSLQSSDYQAEFPREQSNLQLTSNPMYIRRSGAVPVYAGKDFQPVVLNLEVIMQHDFMTLFESLNQLFDTKDETPRQFIATDEEDSSKQYYVYATAKQVQGGHDGPMAVVTLALDDPIWQAVTQTSQTWSTTSTTSTTDVSNPGNDYTYPIFEITPTSAPTTDYSYQMPVQVVPQAENPWNGRFLDIAGATDTTFDTAALVAAGKMQADGDDLRVFRDGIEVDRWLDGINTTDTHVIVVADMPPQYNLLLKTAIGATDTVTEVEIRDLPSIRTAMSSMPSSGRFVICSDLGTTDTEEFTYTAKTMTDTKLAFTVGARAVRNTTALAHIANDDVFHVPYDFTIAYGNATVTAPDTDDTKKPIQELTSRNNSFVFNNFHDNAFLRANSWAHLSQTAVFYLTRSGVYTSTNDEGDTDPATVAGLKAKTYEAHGTWNPDTVVVQWYNQFPDYVWSVSASGAQNQTATSVPAVKLQAYTNNTNTFTDLWSIPAQASTDYGTWTAWTKASTDATVPSNTAVLRWLMVGSIQGDTDYYSKNEVDTMTVGLINYPVVHLRGEQASATKLDFTITNDTSGESIQIVYLMPVNDTLYIDTTPDFPYAKHNGVLVNGAVRLSTVRSAWLRLQPGTNTLSYNSNLSSANDITIVVKWRQRANFL